MWRLVREALRATGPVLLAAWTTGIGIVLLVLAIVSVVGSAKDRHDVAGLAQLAPLAILIASMVAGLIVTTAECSERRVRLHVMLPLPIRQVAVARVLLPALFMVAGAVAAHSLLALTLGLEGLPILSARHGDVDFVAAQLLFWGQFVLVTREITELRRRRGWTRTFVPNALLAVMAALTVVIQLVPWGGAALRAAESAALAALLMAFTVVQFARRTQFTR